MCGLAGLMTRPGVTLDETVPAALIAALRHRGPDGDGCYRNGNVTLVHTRLSIIDLPTGGQPLYGPGDTAIVVNGEIYNYIELRAAMPDAAFKTGSDCEPLLHLYDRHGLDFLDDTRGMYALALHDPAAGRLILARDPFGIKPLYIAETALGLAFASEPQALIAAGLVTPDPQALPITELLQLQFTTGARTVFGGITRVLPGEMIIVEDGVIVARQRRAALPPAAIRPQTETEALGTLAALLSDTITIHQRADVPYGLFLSSGIDSAAVLACMARTNDRPVLTFTAGFPGRRVHDERGAAERLAQAVGARYHEVPVSDQDFWSLLPQICAVVDDPVADPAIVPTFMLAREARREVRVVLSGEGGDEMFGGYGRYRRQMRPWWLGGRTRRRRGPCDGLDLLRHGSAGWRDGLGAAEIASRGEGRSRLQAAQALDFVDWLPHALLTKLDRCLMAWGVEGRTPFLDPVVAAFAYRLPDRLKIQGSSCKYLMRRWLEQNFPAAEPFAPKKGFTVPIGEWLAQANPRLGDLVAADPGIAAWCRPETVRAVFAGGDRKQRELQWRLLFLALWGRRHIRGLAPDGDVLHCLSAPQG
ncbi:MAG: asparagine synthase (glutamine-hydrolyzing) [Azospirillaceae bacterium]|nr:asparagine synthase (glutamine-hydrolyzing) [Azospirillaceae bacterium]